jgi:hypothetical protein
MCALFVLIDLSLQFLIGTNTIPRYGCFVIVGNLIPREKIKVTFKNFKIASKVQVEILTDHGTK